MPSFSKRSAVAFELATAASNCNSGNKSIKKLTVLPVPTPKMPPLGKCFKAAFAAACFFSSWVAYRLMTSLNYFDICCKKTAQMHRGLLQ